jgi:hypothetical protein
MPDAERDAAIATLQSFADKFTGIMDLIGDSNGLTGDKKTQAQELLRELKDGLKAETKELHRRRDKLNKYEKAFVEPALREADADIMTAVNTTPNQKWRTDLYGARMDVTHLLDQLKNLPADWSPGIG